MTGLADCNNFFVSCERSVNPDLCGRPVVVLSNNDGCVVARSNEAKSMGVRMCQPAFQLRDDIRSGRLVAISGNHLLYRRISLKIHDIIRRFAPDTLDYSVDESFLIMDGIPFDALPEIGKAIVDSCLREARIPVTVGFAPTKTLAKIVCESCKRSEQRVNMALSAENMLPAMESLPIEELWGIGRRLARRLYSSGISTIRHLYDKDLHWVRSNLGINGERTWRELHGEPCITMEHVKHPLQQSISESRTFPQDVTDPDLLRARITRFASHCASQLRDMAGLCSRIGVFLQTNRFSATPLVTPQGIRDLPTPSDITTDIVDAAIDILADIYIPSLSYKRGGVWLENIIAAESYVPSVFDVDSINTSRRKRMRSLMRAVDRLNTGPAAETIGLASRITGHLPGHNDGYSSSFQSPSTREKHRPESGSR